MKGTPDTAEIKTLVRREAEAHQIEFCFVDSAGQQTFHDNREPKFYSVFACLRLRRGDFLRNGRDSAGCEQLFREMFVEGSSFQCQDAFCGGGKG